MKHLKYGDALLADIVRGLAALEDVRVDCIQVTFRVGAKHGVRDEASYEFGLLGALDAIACDLYWDERGDWSDADCAIVEVL